MLTLDRLLAPLNVAIHTIETFATGVLLLVLVWCGAMEAATITAIILRTLMLVMRERTAGAVSAIRRLFD
jgi:hypothetical protein